MTKVRIHWNAWFDIAEKKIKESEYGYLVSWHLARDLDIPTKHVNYRLDRLVKEGKLRKETNVYCSKYFLTSQII